MDKIKWCFYHGLELVEPNKDLYDGYMIKATSALKSCDEVSAIEWKIEAAYYAMYHSVYAILMLVGIKSEIHDCTITLMSMIGFSKYDVLLIENAKKLRIDMQYYVNRNTSNGVQESVLLNAKAFVNNSKEIASHISVADLRATLRKILDQQ